MNLQEDILNFDPITDREIHNQFDLIDNSDEISKDNQIYARLNTGKVYYFDKFSFDLFSLMLLLAILLYFGLDDTFISVAIFLSSFIIPFLGLSSSDYKSRIIQYCIVLAVVIAIRILYLGYLDNDYSHFNYYISTVLIFCVLYFSLKQSSVEKKIQSFLGKTFHFEMDLGIFLGNFREMDKEELILTGQFLLNDYSDFEEIDGKSDNLNNNEYAFLIIQQFIKSQFMKLFDAMEGSTHGNYSFGKQPFPQVWVENKLDVSANIVSHQEEIRDFITTISKNITDYTEEFDQYGDDVICYSYISLSNIPAAHQDLLKAFLTRLEVLFNQNEH